MNPHNIINCVCWFMLLSAVVFAQDSVTDSVDVSSYSAMDSVWQAVTEQQPDIDLTMVFVKLFWIIIVLSVSILLWKYLIHPVLRMIFKNPNRLNAVQLIVKGILIILVLHLIIAKIMQPGSDYLLLLYGIVLLVIALAVQDYVRDFISGIRLIYFSSIKPGDQIHLEGIRSRGELVHIGLLTTQFKKESGAAFQVANRLVRQQILPQDEQTHSLTPADVYFYLPHDIDLIVVKEIAYRAASLSPFIYLNKSIRIRLTNEFRDGRSIVVLKLSAFVLAHEHCDQFISDTTENVLRELREQNILPAYDAADSVKNLTT